MATKGNPGRSPIQGVFGEKRTITGLTPKMGVLGNLDSFGIDDYPDRSLASEALRALHSSNDSISVEGARLLGVLGTVESLKGGSRPGYGNSAFGRQLSELATLMEAGLGVEAAAVGYGGWDFHRNHTQRMSRLAPVLAAGLSSFIQDAAVKNTTVVVFTEFGRTVNENGNRGTDHGKAFTAMVMGPAVKGGVYGNDFPSTFNGSGSRTELPLTTDYRKIIAEVTTKHMGVSNLGAVLPGYNHTGDLGLIR